LRSPGDSAAPQSGW